MRLFLRILLWGIILLLVVVAGFTAWITIPNLSDPIAEYASRKGTLLVAKQEGVASLGQMDYLDFTLKSNSGLKVLLSVRKPRQFTRPLPLVIMLGGHRTGRNAVRLINTSKPVIVAALSYPHDANPRAKGFAVLPGIPEYSKAFRDITPAVLLVLDYLAAQSYVDKQRIELVGISLGAFLVSVPGALDTRLRRTWLVHGAGDPQQVIAHNLRHRIKHDGIRNRFAKLLMVLISGEYLRPEKWVGRIAANKVIAINARDDERLPATTVAKLHQALPRGAEVIWTTGQHVEPGRNEVISRLTEIIFQRVAAD